MPDTKTVLAVLWSYGFCFTAKRALLWRLLSHEAGNIKGLPSFGLCHAIATDGVHMIVLHGNGKDVLEVSVSNWEPHKPDNSKPKSIETKTSPVDKTAAALTRLFADLM